MKKLLVAIIILSACSPRYPILDPSKGQIIHCNGNIGTVKFDAVKKGYALADFYFEDCQLQDVQIIRNIKLTGDDSNTGKASREQEAKD